MDKLWEHYAKRNKLVTERQILPDFTHMKYLNSPNHRIKEWNVGFQGVGVDRNQQESSFS